MYVHLYVCLRVGVYIGRVVLQNLSFACPIAPALDRKDMENNLPRKEEYVAAKELGLDKETGLRLELRNLAPC